MDVVFARIIACVAWGLIFLGLISVGTAPTPWLFFSQYKELPEPLKPFRPSWLGLFNSFAEPWSHVVAPFNPDSLLREAKYRVGYDDLDDENGSFREGLSRLCEALEKESELNFMGRMLIREPLVLWISNRLKVSRQLKENNNKLPPVRGPVFVIGMPRSGTTFLHNLMSLDEESFRAPRLWEILDPDPPLPATGREWERWARVTLARVKTTLFRYFARNVHAVHPIVYSNAEECMPILCISMQSLQYNTLSNVTSYNDWYLARNQDTAFMWHERLLRVLQSAEDKENWTKVWLLKAPIHLAFLDALLRRYPDAWIISSHRDPTDMLASLSSLHARFYGIVSDSIHPKAIGAYQTKQWEFVLKRFLASRNALTKDQQSRVLDLSFRDLSSDPIGTVRRVYAHLGKQFNAKVEARMRSWLREDEALGKRGAAGEHIYNSSWFGLDPNEIAKVDVFQEYSKKFVKLSIVKK